MFTFHEFVVPSLRRLAGLPARKTATCTARVAVRIPSDLGRTEFAMVSLAENARVPIDNPTTHLELTMIHEAMILEYSGRHLALIEWAACLKLFAYSCLGIALFFPFGIPDMADPLSLLIGIGILIVKLTLGGFLLALCETLSAKMRIFRAPEFLGTAFLLSVLAVLINLLLETK